MMAPTKKPASLPGTRPKGVHTEHEAAKRVREMFSRIAPRYDFLNRFLSFTLDQAWRKRTAKEFRRILRRTDARVLDLCCGTGDLAFALEHERLKSFRDRGAYRMPIIGSDFAEPMLERACQKAGLAKHYAKFVAADALQLPFPTASFDLVTAAFGFRNLANYERGVREIARVLKPGGEVGILEFSEPSRGPMAPVFRFYFRRILPMLGGAISGSLEAYSYLPRSVQKFPSPKELTQLFKSNGFGDVKTYTWNFGSVVLHRAERS
jgi:demethylmenaquinone methyltransferase / 2-methoxy-6-polyprenyl-1,4-benzoquinol methylase